MHFLIDKNKKIVFGWSAKCGCSHIKTLFLFLTRNKIYDIEDIHRECKYLGINEIINNINDYTIIIISRNPYDRLISGFLEKYTYLHYLHNPNIEEKATIRIWENNLSLSITFNNFVNQLVYNNYNIIDQHHFTPQLSEKWDDILLSVNNIIVYDLSNIDYKFIEYLYNISIPPELINFKGPHINKNKLDDNIDNNFKVYNLDPLEYRDMKLNKYNFLNKDLQDKIYQIYKKDFEFFKSKGVNYL